MTAPRFAASKEAKAAGWFSRRHETREAHDAARESYREKRGRKRNRGRKLRRKP